MTTKQIAEAVNRPEKTVRTWVKKTTAKSATITAKLAVGSPTNPADYDLDDTVLIIETGLGKNAASLFRENAVRNPVALEAIPQDAGMQDAFKALTRGFEMLITMVKDQNSRLQSIEGRVQERQALLPPPQVSPEAHVNMLVRSYAEKNNILFQDVFGELYREFYYRHHRDINAMRKARKVSGIQVAVDECLIGELEALAVHLYGE